MTSQRRLATPARSSMTVAPMAAPRASPRNVRWLNIVSPVRKGPVARGRRAAAEVRPARTRPDSLWSRRGRQQGPKLLGFAGTMVPSRRDDSAPAPNLGQRTAQRFNHAGERAARLG